MIRRAAIVATVLVALGVAAWTVADRLGWTRRTLFRLPARIAIETVVADLTATLNPAAVMQAPAAGGVQLATLQPGDGFLHEGARRNALIAPPGTRLRYRVHAPASAALRLAFAVEGSGGDGDRSAAGVRFSVSVDGQRRLTQAVNPAATRRDRRWFDEEIPLTTEAGGRDVEIALTTDADGRGTLAGTPGWSQVRVVGRRYRDRQPTDPSRPNVLVLLVDTLRGDHLGCYGAAPSPSPTPDELAGRGALFRQHVAQAPWTLPSVASILTGRYPTATGTHGRPGDTSQAIRDELVTLAELAEEQGITTLGISTNPMVSRGTNFAQGFEKFVEVAFTTLRAPADDPEAKKNPTTAAEVNDLFLRWLTENRAHRFFAYLHYMEPHHPCTPPTDLWPPVPPGVRPRVAAGRLSQWGTQIHTPCRRRSARGGTRRTSARYGRYRPEDVSTRATC